jgi:hypothetical protein
MEMRRSPARAANLVSALASATVKFWPRMSFWPMPQLRGAQLDAVARQQVRDLPVGSGQCVLDQLQHRGAVSGRGTEIHGHDVDAGDGDVTAQHRAEDRQRIILQAGRFDRQGEPHGQRMVRLRGGALDQRDGLRPALPGGEVVQRCALDVQVDGGQVVPADDRLVGTG